jgi:hypothetical protein
VIFKCKYRKKSKLVYKIYLLQYSYKNNHHKHNCMLELQRTTTTKQNSTLNKLYVGFDSTHVNSIVRKKEWASIQIVIMLFFWDISYTRQNNINTTTYISLLLFFYYYFCFFWSFYLVLVLNLHDKLKTHLTIYFEYKIICLIDFFICIDIILDIAIVWRSCIKKIHKGSEETFCCILCWLLFSANFYEYCKD